ncbi:MAG: aminoacyl-tRNA hydrolase [Pseudomonadota bacterium]
MYLLVGLGNPGSEYERHRHNVGFKAVDAIGDANNFGEARSKFKGQLREGRLGGRKALILKPQTYMNESGQSVRAAARFYKIELDEIFVFYDELDLAPGKLRTKVGGGAAGHNGIRSIDAHIGNAFHRIRIGIGHPGDKSKVTRHVLGDFAKSDRDWLDPMLDAIAICAPAIVDDPKKYVSDVMQRLSPAQTKEKKAPAAKQAKKTDCDNRCTSDQAPATKAAGSNPFTDALGKLLGREPKS